MKQGEVRVVQLSPRRQLVHEPFEPERKASNDPDGQMDGHARWARVPTHSGDVRQARGACTISSPITLTENALRVSVVPLLPCNVSM